MFVRTSGLLIAAMTASTAWAVPISAPTPGTYGPPNAKPELDVAAAGDLNFDGQEDLLLGDPSAFGTGMAHLRFGGPAFGFTPPLIDIFGTTAGDNFGYAVDGHGDFNCDGFDDFVVGAPTDQNFLPGHGAVYVYFGPLAPGAYPAPAAGLILLGEFPGDRAGHAVQLIPDVDFDGCEDLLIGAPRHGPAAGVIGSGAAYIVQSSWGLGGIFPLGMPGVTKFNGMNPGDAFGWSVDQAGDFDGDGRQDIVVGAPFAQQVGMAHIIPRVPVLLGGVWPVGPVAMTLRGTVPLGEFGFSVDGNSDLNFDGTTEVLIGAPQSGMSTTTALGRGAVHITSATMLPIAPGGIFPANAHTAWHVGAVAGGQLGWDVSFPGDHTGDGRPDYAASAPRIASGGGTGITYIRRGFGIVPPPGLIGPITMAPAPFVVTPVASVNVVGYAIDGSPDNDLDGRPDLLVGAHRGPAGGAGRVLVGSY